MKKTIIFLLLSFATISPSSHAANVKWSSEIYADTLNQVDIRAGLNFYLPKNSPRNLYGSRFKYVDLEVGVKGQKLGLGVGRDLGEGQHRFGLSFATIDGNKLVGAEYVLFVWNLAIKVGGYGGLEGAPNQAMVGIGIGLHR